MNKAPRIIGAIAVFTVLLLVAPVQAHEPPSPRKFETRILVDQNDDCGGHGGYDNCRGTHDLVGFNVREAFDESLGNVVIFTLIADLGDPSRGKLTDTFTYNVGGTAKTVVFETSDDKAFSVAGAARVVGPEPLRNSDGTKDGTRFTVDAWFLRSDVGKLGDELEGFKVEAKVGSTRGDIMPGGYISPLTGSPVDGSDPSTQYARASYTLKGPVQYIGLSAEDHVEVESGETVFMDLQVKNLLSDMGQTLKFVATANGIDVGFHDPGAPMGEYPASYQESVAKGRDALVHLAVTGHEAGATGKIDLTITTDRGGHVAEVLSFAVLDKSSAGDLPGQEPETPVDESTPAAALAVTALALLTAVRRR